MQCLMPVRYYRNDTGRVFHSPNRVKVASEGFRPCQTCMNCRLRRAQSSAIRMLHESRFHSQSSFLTLTYSDDKLPPNGSLRYDDVSSFIKRLRRRLDRTLYKNSLTFYRVGEYGENYSRPHYHMILFGFDFSEKLEYHGVQNEKKYVSKKDDRLYYKSSFLTDCWSHGFADIGNVDYATCLYAAKYVTKKLYGSQASFYDQNLLTPERPSSSKHMPIGLRWIQKYWKDVYPHDYVIHDGKKLPPPRFYDEWLQKNQPDIYEAVKQNRENNLQKQIDWRDLHAKHVLRRQQQQHFLRDGCAPNLTNDDAQIERKLSTLQDIAEGLL